MVPSAIRFKFTSGAGWPGMGSKLNELRAQAPLKSMAGFSAAKPGERQIEPHSSPAAPRRNMTIPPQKAGHGRLDTFRTINELLDTVLHSVRPAGQNQWELL